MIFAKLFAGLGDCDKDSMKSKVIEEMAHKLADITHYFAYYSHNCYVSSFNSIPCVPSSQHTQKTVTAFLAFMTKIIFHGAHAFKLFAY